MTAPRPNCRAPSRAAAEPARCGFDSSAIAGAEGITSPTVPRVSIMSRVSGQNGAPATATATSTKETATPATTPPARICCGRNRPTSAPAICVPAVIDTAPPANTQPNSWAVRPYPSWKTNVDEET